MKVINSDMNVNYNKKITFGSMDELLFCFLHVFLGLVWFHTGKISGN